MDLLKFCKLIPKVELHAHLNGSLSEEALTKLNVRPTCIQGYQIHNFTETTPDRLKECFKLFKVAHEATTTVTSIYEATKYVIEEFYKDNVFYLELRTTPRNEKFMTKREYVESVVKAIKDNTNNIIVKLILSIDRTHQLPISEEALNLIIDLHKLYPDIIKGVDLCGNPNSGLFFKDLFTKVRSSRLCTTLHCGEVNNNNEILEMLEFKPDRIGHGTFIHPDYGGSNENWELYSKLKIPLECCLTSNVLCGTSEGYEKHHIQKWINAKLPFSINTDDKGVFNTNLSDEYFYAGKYLNLSKQYLVDCVLTANESSFGSNSDKMNVKSVVHNWKEKNVDLLSD